jgi:hypothetical protein
MIGDKQNKFPNPKMIDRTGFRYGMLTVKSLSKKVFRSFRHGYANYWLCICDCGKETEVYQSNLVNGNTKSCGCQASRNFIAQKVTTHGMTNTGTYKSWSSMKDRCYQPAHSEYKRYGGRGINVCERWKNSFENFYEDMGERPYKHSLERIDPNTGYSPDNCKWATVKEQANNKRSNVMLMIDGRRQSLSLWVDEFGLNYETVYARLKRGWSVERAFELKVGQNK